MTPARLAQKADVEIIRGAEAISDLASYDYIILYFSGGKDSLACYLHLLERGIDPARIEIWHHEIDGREGSRLMDWPVTPAYCRAVARHFGSPFYLSWKVGGFEGEMLRQDSLTQPTRFEVPGGGIMQVGGDRGKRSTRRRFPQVSADLKTRWCSAYLKIDVAATAIRNQTRFIEKRTLTISGERGDESPGRAKYATFEPDKADNRTGHKSPRHVDRWRPVHGWSEADVWAIIERWGVNPHPAYKLGWGRVSCRFCIFGNDNQWASAAKVDPEGVQRLIGYEIEFGCTIHRTKSLPERIKAGTPYEAVNLKDWAAAMSTAFDQPVILDKWLLPAGAFGESCGPT